jgi:hypothetical protein
MIYCTWLATHFKIISAGAEKVILAETFTETHSESDILLGDKLQQQ